MFRSLIDKVLFHGLDAERRRMTRLIVARFARGNVSVQNGRYLSDDDLADLRAKGDRAWARVRARLALGK